MAEINLNSLPNNSQKAKNEVIVPVNKKDIPAAVDKKKVVAKAQLKKKAPGRDLLEEFVTEDLGIVASYVLYDIALPAIKTLVSDVVSNGIDMLLFGDAGGRRSSRRSGSYSNSSISYNSYYGNSKGSSGRYVNTTAKQKRIDDLIFRSRGEAEDVYDILASQIKQYGNVSMADLLEMVGQESRWTDNSFGWESIDGFRVERGIDGYVLRVPRPIQL